jgi:hypothetical protein
MGDDDLGNVVLSRPFQFAEYLQVTVDSEQEEDDYGRVYYEDIFTPVVPNQLKKIKDRSIYAIELGEKDGDQKPILAAEFLLDPDGAMKYVAGAVRRKVEVKSAPAGKPVPAASLPIVRQGKRLRHVFVAIRGRLSKSAIMDIEDGLHPIYEKMNLADDWFFKGDQKTFIVVIDPLTLGEQLNIAYQKALNEATKYNVPFKENDDKAAVELRARKYQLARMIKKTLLEPPRGAHDPLELHDHLAGGGHKLLNWFDEHEHTLRKLDGQRTYRANQLIRLLNSGIWMDAHRWYLGKKEAALEIGHCWLDATFCSVERLGEVPEGRHLQQQLVNDSKYGLLSYLFPPEEEGSALEEFMSEKFPIMRKAATAAVIGFAEMAPALAVYSKVRAANKRILRTMKLMLVSTDVSLAVDFLTGEVVTKLKVHMQAELVKVPMRPAKVDLEKWIEDGKPHWPERTKAGEFSEKICKYFIGVEAINLVNTLKEFLSTMGGQGETSEKIKASVEMFGATLDLVVAAEDPIRAYARQLDRMYKTAPAEAVEEVAEGAGAAEEEAAGIFGKITKPIVFKGLGLVSAAIDTVINFMEMQEDLKHGDRGTALGHGALSAGSFAILTSSAMVMTGYAGAGAALTAAAATLMVIGVVIVVAGFILLAYFSKTAWQKFARHSIFGVEPAAAGEENWSGGNFSHWTETVDGIERQIRVLTAMLCAFKVKGAGLDDYTIFVEFTSVPPQSKMDVQFTYKYENGRTHSPSYMLDLESGACEFHGDAHYAPDCPIEREEDRIKGFHLRAQAPDFQSRITEARCALRLRYAPQNNAKDANGMIPMAAPVDYLIRDSTWGMGHMDEVSSLDVKAKEEEEEKKEEGGAEAEPEAFGMPM